MRRLLITGLLAIESCALFAGLAQAAEPPLPPTLKAQVEHILKASQASGAAIVLVDGLGVSGAFWQGALQTATGQPVGAAGNALVALAAMRLTERGKLDLYAPLPKLAGVLSTCKTKPTLSHLLEHTSGSGAACPGNQTAYSDLGVALAALALEKITKTNMTALMQREVFKPLGMKSSHWGAPALSSVGEAVSHKKGLVTTPLDMASLVQMLVLRGQLEAKTYLPQCAVERMGISVSAISMPGGNTPAAIERSAYGLGLERFKAGGQPWLGYSGDMPGSQWVWGYSSQSQNGMVIMVNGVDAKTIRALKEVVAKHLQKDVVLLAQR